MKKLILSIFLVLALTIPAFAQVDIAGPKTTGNLSPITGANVQQGQAQSNTNTFTPTNINTNKVDNKNTNVNTNANYNNNENRNTNLNTNVQGQNQDQRQGQIQAQGQGQGQGQNQFGYVNIESTQGLLGVPSQSIPELGFGQGKLDWNFARALPKVAIPLYAPNETVKKVLDTTANVKAKNLLPKLLDMVADQQPLAINDRLIIIKAEAQKSWNTGGNVGGAGSYLPTSGLAGASGAGSLVPSWGGTKADDLYTIIIVRVAL